MVKIQLPITNYPLPITYLPVMYQTSFIRVAQLIIGSTLFATAGLTVKIDARAIPTMGQVRSQTVVSQNIPGYNPQPLGRGYAVLVDFFNQPEIAQQVQQLLGKEVGLVSFAQRPYLLILHTTNESNATKTFQLLNERGFFAVMVDGEKVTVLRSRVINEPSRTRNPN
jgi:hypothetical protein